MRYEDALLRRLDAIGAALAATGRALALLGLGSVGVEQSRLDAYSDLDFFAIVKPGFKRDFLDNLDWLEAAHPLAYFFQNTVDGHKALFADGIFCEYAVFEPDELAPIPFAGGRVVWSAPNYDTTPLIRGHIPARESHPVEWLLGEALTNLYVGLGRFRRGEKLSGGRLVQVYAVDRLVELADLISREQAALHDPFGGERHFERRFPDVAPLLPGWVQGYERTPESARAILAFLEAHFAVNPAVKARIKALLADDAGAG